MYTGIRMTIVPENTSRIEGQEIWLTVTVESGKECSVDVRPLMSAGDNGIYLFSEGVEVPASRGGAYDLPPIPNKPGSTVSYEVQINETFHSPGSAGDNGFLHLLPGRYCGYFHLGIQSPDFCFAVREVPDSLKDRWNDFVRLKYFEIHSGYLLSKGQMSALDSIRAMAMAFSRLPAGHPWRLEALKTGLQYMSRMRAQWGVVDSTAVIQMLQELGVEPEVRIDALTWAAREYVYKDQERWIIAKSLDELADRLYPPKVGDKLREAARKIRQSTR